MEDIPTTAKILGLPVYTVRKMVLNGQTEAVRAGRRIFVNVDKFKEFLNTSRLTAEPETDEAARIKPIPPNTYGGE